MSRLIEKVREGTQTTDIIDDAPEFAFRIRDIDILRQTLLSEMYLAENRDISVTYLFGASGTGKTRSIFEQHEAREICRVPIIEPRKASALTATADKTCWCLRNSVPKYRLRIC